MELSSSAFTKLIWGNLFRLWSLITNDNGIKDIKLIKLAQAFALIAETYVVAPLENKSGSATPLATVE